VKVFFAWHPVTRQVAIKLVLPELGNEYAHGGPVLLPGEDVSSWTKDVVTALTSSGLLRPEARETLLQAARDVLVPLGLAWLDRPGKLRWDGERLRELD
jgi:hypothetical protein